MFAHRYFPLPVFPAFLCLTGYPCSARADLTVNAAQTIMHVVRIQPILTRKTEGTTAGFLGTAEQEAYIKGQVSRVWAQVGVRVAWLPPAIYISNFAYDGSPADYSIASRPTTHLKQMVDAATTPPKNADTKVLNLFFVGILPGFPRLPDDAVAGYSYVDANGSSVYVGVDLPEFIGGQDGAATALAHEIGANLGLTELAAGGDNLMSQGGSSQRLTAAQKTTILNNKAGADGFEMLQPGTANSNFEEWAASLSLTGGASGDPDRDGIVNVLEYMLSLDPKKPGLLPEPVAGVNGLTWTLTKHQKALDDGLHYKVQASTDLQTWLAADAEDSGCVTVEETANSVTVRLLPGVKRRFMSLRVELPDSLE